MATKTQSKCLDSRSSNGGAPKAEELSDEERMEKANQALRKAWKLIYNRKDKEQDST